MVGGAVYETAQLVLPRLVRRSRLYEATAKNLLRVAIELVGGAVIVEELYESGELQAKLDEALGADRETAERTAALA